MTLADLASGALQLAGNFLGGALALRSLRKRLGHVADRLERLEKAVGVPHVEGAGDTPSPFEAFVAVAEAITKPGAGRK